MVRFPFPSYHILQQAGKGLSVRLLRQPHYTCCVAMPAVVWQSHTPQGPSCLQNCLQGRTADVLRGTTVCPEANFMDICIDRAESDI